MRLIRDRRQLVAWVVFVALVVIGFHRQEDTNERVARTNARVAAVAAEAAVAALNEARTSAIRDCEGRRSNTRILLGLVDRTGGSAVPTEGLDPAVLKLLEQSRQSAMAFREYAVGLIGDLPDCELLPRPAPTVVIPGKGDNQ